MVVSFGNAYLAGKTYTITFRTKVETSDKYDNNSQKFINNASIKCYFPADSGIGPCDWESGEVTCTAAEHMLSKKCIGFVNATGMIQWQLNPSCGTSSFKEAVITDKVGYTYTKGSSGYIDGKGNTQTIHEDKDGDYAADVKVQINGKDVGEDAYTYKISEADKTLIITFKGCDSDSCTDHNNTTDITNATHLSSEELNQVTITYYTHAEDWGVTANANGTATEQTYYNAASLQVDTAKTAKTVYAGASVQKTDTMLSKSAKSYYDNDTGDSGFQYTINVNTQGVKLNGTEGAILTDDLSALNDSLTYQRIKDNGNNSYTYEDVTDSITADDKAKLVLKKVLLTVDGIDTDITEKLVTDSNATDGYKYIGADIPNGTLGTLILDLSDKVADGKTVKVTLDVEITNSNDLFLEGYVVSGTNTASVATKTPNGETGAFSASCGGHTNDTITNKRVEKSYQKDETNKRIKYTIKVNPWAAKMGKVVLADKLTNAAVEYDDESFKLYTATNDGAGKLTRGDEVTEGWSASFTNDADGKTKYADITIDECNQPYWLEYEVIVLVDDRPSGYAVNEVMLSLSESNYDSSSCSVDISSWGSATGATVDKLTINKMYKDPVTGADKALAGATFGLIKGAETNEPYKTAVSDENGQAIFKGLALNRDYWVKEISAPEGYEAVDSDVTAFHTRETAEEITADPNADTVTGKFYNTRKTGSVEFTKVDANGYSGLGGAKFLLYYEENGTTKLVTVSGTDGAYKYAGMTATGGDVTTDIENSSGNAVIESAQNGTKGSVKVANIPWGEGTYYFVEAEGPNGYMADTDKHYSFTITLDDDGNVVTAYDTVSADGKFITGEISGDTRYLILNSKYKFMLIKQDENEKPIQGVKFGLYTEAGTELFTFETDKNGTAMTIDNCIKEDTVYKLKELSAPDEYCVSNTVVTFKIASSTHTLLVQNETGFVSGKVTYEDYTINTAARCFTLTDTAALASVELLKKDQDGVGIKGVGFELYKLANADVTADALTDEKNATLICSLETDSDGSWKSSKAAETVTYTDAHEGTRKVSDGLMVGWYCFRETTVPDNVVRSDTLYKFCIERIEDGTKAAVATGKTTADENSVVLDLSADKRFEIVNSRIKAYLRKEDSDGNLLTDDKNELAFTLYQKSENGGWEVVKGAEKLCPGTETDDVPSGYDSYSNDIGSYLQIENAYKLVETTGHSDSTYMKADDYYFRVDSDGSLYQQTSEDDEEGTWLDPAVIVMTDATATMAIQNHYTHDGSFEYTITDSEGNTIVTNETLRVDDEGASHEITTTVGGSDTVYMLKRGETYTLTSTYYLTADDYEAGNGYDIVTVVICDDYGQLRFLDEDGNAGDALTDNTFHIYGLTQIVVKKVAADGVLEGKEIPKVRMRLMKDGKTAPTMAADEGMVVSWSWTTDGYKQGTASSDTAVEITGSDGKTYVYQNPDGNLNKRTGYVAGFSGATVFTLQEINAPAEYTDAEDIEFSFADDGTIKIISGADEEQVVIDDDGIVTVTMKDSLSDTDNRTVGYVEFTKVDDSDAHQGLGGAQFLLYYEEDGAAKLVKTTASEDTEGVYTFAGLADTSETLADDITAAGGAIVSAEGGTVGYVKVTDIPWDTGAYYFVEAQGPNGYPADTSRKYRFTITLDDDGKTVTTYYTETENGKFIDSQGDAFTGTFSGDTRYLILNSGYQFKLYKHDSNSKPVAGVAFGLYTDKDCTTLLAFNGNDDGVNPFATDANGWVTVCDSAIKDDTTYYLKELDAPCEFGVSTEVVAFQVDSNTKKLIVIDTTTGDKITAADGEVKLKDYTIETNEKLFTVTDTALLASVSLLKQDEDGNGIEGVTFDLYKLGENKDVTAADLGDETKATRIVEGLATDANGLWSSTGAAETYTDSVGNTRKVSEGLTGGWYCFRETSVPGNVIISDDLYKFCIIQVAEAGTLKTIVTDENGNDLKAVVDLSADARFTIYNSRIKAYLRKEGVDKNGKNTGLLTDEKDELTLTLYKKTGDGWAAVQEFKPRRTELSGDLLGKYTDYSNELSDYLQIETEYKLVETTPHSSLTYMKAEDYYFMVDRKGDLYEMTLTTDENGNSNFTTAAEALPSGVIVMQDEESTMAIQNHYTHAGVFLCSISDSDGNTIVANQTLVKTNEGSANGIMENGIDNDATGTTTSTALYRLQRGATYTLTSTYYLTQTDYDQKKNGYITTTAVTCNEYGQLIMANGLAMTENTFHIYGATQITVKKVAASGDLAGYEIPGAKLKLLQDGKKISQVAYDGAKGVDWSWTTDGYKPVKKFSGKEGASTLTDDNKLYEYKNPGGNLNARTGYVAGFSGATVFTLTETKAPSGYKRAEVTFSLMDDGKVAILSEKEKGTATVTMDESGSMTIVMQDVEGVDKKTSGGSSKKSSSTEAVVETSYSSAERTSDTTTPSTVQWVDIQTNVEEESKEDGRNVKTEDKLPIALYVTLSIVTLGAFAILTILLKRLKRKLQ